MKIKVGGCYGSVAPGFRSAGFLINDSLLLEGGTVTSAFTIEEQAAVRNILISHIHLDHTKEIFFLLDNRAQVKASTVTLNGIGEIIEGAQLYLFNQQIWPDFSQLENAGHPLLAFRTIEENAFSKIDEFMVKPIRVSHPVTATGYIIREGDKAMAYTGDTGPTKRFWEEVRKEAGLAAVFVETSFPNDMEEVALASGHLTPSLLEKELALLDRPEVPIYIFHMKPMHVETITEEIGRIYRDGIEILHDGSSYTF